MLAVKWALAHRLRNAMKGAPQARDLTGGLASAVVALAQLCIYGLLAFGALGIEHAGDAVRSAFATVIFGAFVASMAGGTPIAGPATRASATLVFASLIAQLAADPMLAASGSDKLPAILFLGAVSLALAGAMQIGFGLARLGSIARFVPYPVVSGFMAGVAVLIVLAQIPHLIGVAPPLEGRQLIAALPGTHLSPLLVGLSSIAAVWFAASRFKRVPPALIALIAATLFHHLLLILFPGVTAGGELGPIGASLPAPDALAPAFTAPGQELLTRYWPPMLSTATAIAVIGSLDSLIGASAADLAHNTQHDPNRELVGLGLGNIVSSVFGGIPLVFSPANAGAAYKAGARTRCSGAVSPLILAATFFVAAPLLAHIPFAALAGIMVMVGLGMVDHWVKGLVLALARGRLTREGLGSIAVVAAVCLVTILFHFVVAVVFGLIVSMALFIAAMSRSLVRRSLSGVQRPSRRVYPVELTRYLREHGRAIRVLELEGAIFFGSAVGLAREVELQARTARHVILDMRRVRDIDATGAMALEQLAHRLAGAGVVLYLAHVMADGRLGRLLAGYRTFLGDASAAWFKDVDGALERAERAVLSGAELSSRGSEIAIHETQLFSKLTPEQLTAVRGFLERRELGAGEVLFREGEPGDRLYVLTRGSVTILVGSGNETQRILSFEPGVVFGEMALLDGKARSATAVADEACVAYSLSARAFERILAMDPMAGNAILLQISRHLASQLRIATDSLRAASDAGD